MSNLNGGGLKPSNQTHSRTSTPARMRTGAEKNSDGKVGPRATKNSSPAPSDPLRPIQPGFTPGQGQLSPSVRGGQTAQRDETSTAQQTSPPEKKSASTNIAMQPPAPAAPGTSTAAEQLIWAAIQDHKQPRPSPSTAATEGVRAEELAQISQAWSDFCLTVSGQQTAVKNTTIFTKSFLQPKTHEDLMALKAMVNTAVDRAAQHDENHRDHRMLEQLAEAYKKNLPRYVLNADVTRNARTLQALLEENVTPEMLSRACNMSKFRDALAQLVVSTGGYASTFFTNNSLLAILMRDNASSQAKQSLPPLALTAAGLAMQRFLRMAEMYPGWTKTVGADSEGNPVHALETSAGFMKTAAQYWPFVASLIPASLFPTDPLAQVEWRRDWGFLSTGGVAAHRALTFDRDHVWLNAKTDKQRQAMIGAINELTGVKTTISSALKYAFVRPVAGVAGMIGWDAHGLLNQAGERWVSGVNPEEAGRFPYAANAPGSCEANSLGPTLKRAALLFLPMLAFQLTRALTTLDSEASDLIDVGCDVFLIIAWGVAMGYAEDITRKDHQHDTTWRMDRQLTALARRAGPPPAAVAPSALSPERKDGDMELGRGAWSSTQGHPIP